ncbi:NADH-quinone oxidoreductase subunit N [Acidipila sp. EB88]|uniref:NADH-quinone oxidoreductase subunit N n=1 Tax=Acidipila sp. EB88 TaxID=2305226 RepID=UPI000F6012F1|nr:NADH-quinone oxidoreductase subunit N [Acidipila sp. EB88]RRA49654.1 NADH-quinone oxidoreductase subunit N [Acidipila sp. EB88]
MNPQLLRILPEVILTVTGVLIMLIDPIMPRAATRKSMGWLAVLGTLLALFASIQQLHLAPGTAYFNTVQTDAFSGFFHILIAGIVLTSLLVTLDTVTNDQENLGELFALTIFGAVGSMLMTSAVELLLIFIALEISSISSYILAGFRRHSAKGPESSIKYFLLGSFATAFFLYGIALVFGATGTTRIGLIAAQLPGSTTPLIATLGVGMILIGLGFKVSAAPFHVWTPDTYEGAPSPIVGMMSTAPKAAAFAVLLRILFVSFPTLYAHWQPLVWWMAVLSMTIGNLGALKQRNVKRMLAYSSIANAGYLLVGFTALSTDGVAAAAFYTVTYAAMNVGIFAVISHVGGYEDRLTTVQDYRGLGYRSPLMGGAMAFFLISLIGIPFTGGFFGKFYVFAAALHSGLVWLAIIGLINSGVAAFYYLRLLAAIYSKPSENMPLEQMPRIQISMLFALLLTVVSTLMLGIMPGRVLSAARAASLTFGIQGSSMTTAHPPMLDVETKATVVQ